MSDKLTRRSFLTALTSAGAAISFGALNFCAAENASGVMPKKVDSLTDSPVITIAHCCDPQLGFGKGDDSYNEDLKRLRKELVKIAEIKPDLVFFGGDMCNNRKDLKKDWPSILKDIEAPCLFAPGNHDIPDPLKRADVDAFCEVFGAEYAAKTINGWKIIVVNSQYCRETEEKELYEKQAAWLQNEIEDAKKAGIPFMLGSHVPPFVKTLDEKDEYFNFPTKVRQDYLDYAIDSGMRFYLAGHTHTTLHRTYRDAPILNGETTCNNFDSHPFGFRLLKIDAQMNYEWNFVDLN